MTVSNHAQRALRLKVDTQALANNWRVMDRLSGAAQAGAAVKADGYGLGIDHVAPCLLDAGAQQFYVAHWSEVQPLLLHAPADSISVLHGPVSSEDVIFARETGVRPVINSLYQARLWLDSGGGLCDLMVDTGINRLGLEMEDISAPLIRNLQIKTLMSHLASADEDSAMNDRQLRRFRDVSTVIPAQQRSLANSAGIALGADYAFDQTRPGLALYGGVPRLELDGLIQQVAYPQSVVLQRRRVNAGESVGYNGSWTATQDTEAAVLAIGYADGLLRCRAGSTQIRFDGTELPLLGKISMDMIVVDCSRCPSISEGDWVDIEQNLPSTAQKSGLSQYEILTMTGQRFRN
ncbi:MAG: alanine racemase [Sphingomonadaceae bacterium]